MLENPDYLKSFGDNNCHGHDVKKLMKLHQRLVFHIDFAAVKVLYNKLASTAEYGLLGVNSCNLRAPIPIVRAWSKSRFHIFCEKQEIKGFKKKCNLQQNNMICCKWPYYGILWQQEGPLNTMKGVGGSDLKTQEQRGQLVGETAAVVVAEQRRIAPTFPSPPESPKPH